jgi:hypothetical protein
MMATSEELRAESERVEAQARQSLQEMKKRVESLYAEIKTILDAFMLYEDNYTKEQERLAKNSDTKPKK